MLTQITKQLPLLLLIAIGLSACSATPPAPVRQKQASKKVAPVVIDKRSPKKIRRITPAVNQSFSNNLSNAALSRLRSRVRYDGSYIKIAYPWGDVPPNIGVCTDVVIRSYRKLGIDLQQQVHRDMNAAFYAYPNLKKWGLSQPDPNIDHRRVYNLRAFFQRRGAALPVTYNPNDYKPGDVVSWMVGPSLPHIGVVVNKRSKKDPRRFMVVHNIAYGPQLEDILFAFPITGHYRYTPDKMNNIPKAITYNNANRKSRSMSTSELTAAARLLNVSNTP